MGNADRFRSDQPKLYTRTATNITLPSRTDIITADGAPGASPSLIFAPLGGGGDRS